MKIRSDFVSNSSSTVYVIAVGHEFMNVLAEDIAKACICDASNSYSRNLKARNRRILDFCINTYQLAYLDKLVIGKHDEEITIASLTKNSKNESLAKKTFDEIVRSLKAAKKRNAPKWLKKDARRYRYDASTNAVFHIIIDSVEGFPVSNDSMDYDFNRSRFIKKQTLKRKEARAKMLFDAAVTHHQIMNNYETTYVDSDIYEITKNTIDNTKDLLRFKYEFESSNNEMRDLIKKYEGYIHDGQRIFVIREAYSGDGEGDFHIYCEDGAKGITGVEYITLCN